MAYQIWLGNPYEVHFDWQGLCTNVAKLFEPVIQWFDAKYVPPGHPKFNRVNCSSRFDRPTIGGEHMEDDFERQQRNLEFARQQERQREYLKQDIALNEARNATLRRDIQQLTARGNMDAVFTALGIPVPAQNRSASPFQKDWRAMGQAASLVGTWQTDVVEDGTSVRMTWHLRPDGTSTYLLQSLGGSVTVNGYWRYFGNLIFEVFDGGRQGQGTVEWINNNELKITIIDNGSPAASGSVRRYHRL